MSNIFEKAARKKVRFPTVRGELTVEQLWDVPLTAAPAPTRDVKFDLDTIARTINSDLKSVSEESFVNTKVDPRKEVYELQLEIVKHIIAVKIAEHEAAKKKAQNAEKRRAIVEAIAARESTDLASKSKDDLLKELAALED